MPNTLKELAERHGATVHQFPGGSVVALRFTPEPPSFAPITAAERTVAELRDDANRLADTVATLDAFGLCGGDTLEHRAALAGVDIGTMAEDVRLLMQAEADTSGALRITRRPLGSDFALPFPCPEVEGITTPAPRGSGVDSTGVPLNLGEWFRATAPDGDWRQIGTIAADGIEVCFRCRGRVQRGRRLSVLVHPANDLVIRGCLACAAGLQDRPTVEGETREDRAESTYDGRLSLAQLKDARLWSFSRDRTFATLDLGEDFRVNLLSRPSGSLELSINFPDMADCAKVIGYYKRADDAHRAAIAEIEYWRKS